MFETIEEHKPPGSEVLYVNVVKTPLYDSSGKIIGLQGIFWDITERKQAEERILLATARLARASKSCARKMSKWRKICRNGRNSTSSHPSSNIHPSPLSGSKG